MWYWMCMKIYMTHQRHYNHHMHCHWHLHLYHHHHHGFLLLLLLLFFFFIFIFIIIITITIITIIVVPPQLTSLKSDTSKHQAPAVSASTLHRDSRTIKIPSSPWQVTSGCWTKIGKHPKMDGENNGKPYCLMDDLGVPLFLETAISPNITKRSNRSNLADLLQEAFPSCLG